MAGPSGDVAARELLSGCAAGVANVFVGHPFDTVKVRLQSSKGIYKNMLHCFSEIWRKEGVRNLDTVSPRSYAAVANASTLQTRGFYRGLSPPLVGGALETGINYLVYSRLLAFLQVRA
jgi:solute carrier family 25 (mitochondrial carnitine/acylcarnitine transporter), member 20/29